MKVHLFNHWFKYKVPIHDIWDSVLHDKAVASQSSKYRGLWDWLDGEYDVGQYYSNRESRNYLVFHDKNHYLTFLLKL